MATVEKLITDIAAIKNAGRAALADKGVSTSADATVYGVIQKIADVYQAGTPEDLAALCATLLGVPQETIDDLDTLNTAMHTINTFALEFLAEHGATGVEDNTLAIIGAQEALIEQGGGGASFTADVVLAPTLSAIVSGFTASVTIQE